MGTIVMDVGGVQEIHNYGESSQDEEEDVYSSYQPTEHHPKDMPQHMEAYHNSSHMLPPNTAIGNNMGRIYNLDRSDLNSAIDSSYCIVENGVQRWQCRLCSKCYTSKHNLVSHILCHMGVRPHVCSVCGKAFKQSAHLTTHMLIHQGIKPHKCPVCQRAFSQIAQVKRHVMTHVNKAPYICPLCQFKCKTPLELQTHLVEHTCGSLQENIIRKKSHDLFSVAKGAQLRCDICDRIFVYPSQLREHMMFHSGTRMFSCSVCNMSFVKEHHLRAHQATHTDQRPHKCPQCGRAFSLKGNMQRHLLIHKQEKTFECEFCQKRFTQSQTLKMHLITHTKDKPFSCEICGKSFTRGHNYRGHVAMHRNAKPYKCECGSAFTLKGNLKRHRKEKHANSQECRQMYLNEEPSPEYIENADNYAVNSSSSVSQIDVVSDSEYNGKLLNVRDGNSAFNLFKKKRKTTPKKVVLTQPNEQMSEHIHPVPLSHTHEENNNMPSLPLDIHLNSSGYVNSINLEANRENTYHSLVPVRPVIDPVPTYDNDSRYFACMRPVVRRDSNSTGDIIHKVHALHAAINNLAIQCGHNTDKVHAIHSVIDELAGKAVQSTLYQ